MAILELQRIGGPGQLRALAAPVGQLEGTQFERGGDVHAQPTVSAKLQHLGLKTVQRAFNSPVFQLLAAGLSEQAMNQR